MPTNSLPRDKTPITTQDMWNRAYEDFTYADIMAKAARSDPGATPQVIARRDRERRMRLAIANAIEFLITNEKDVDAAIAAREKREFKEQKNASKTA